MKLIKNSRSFSKNKCPLFLVKRVNNVEDVDFYIKSTDDNLGSGREKFMKETYEKLYEENRMRLIRYAQKILGDRYDAEDAVEQVFCNIIRNCVDFEDMNEEEIQKYLLKSVKHSSCDILETRKKVAYIEDYDDKGVLREYTTFERVCENISKDTVIGKIQKFSCITNNILYMSLFEGMTCNQIADELHMTESAVKKRIQREKKKLSQMCQKLLEN